MKNTYLLILPHLLRASAQTCGCPPGFYGGYFPGAAPSVIYRNTDLATATQFPDGTNVRGCTGYMRFCKNGDHTKCSDFASQYASSTLLPSLGHPTCELASGISDTGCNWNRMTQTYDPDPGVAKQCYCYSCLPCPAGTHNPATHATTIAQCLNCPPNKWSFSGSTDCHQSFANVTVALESATLFNALTRDQGYGNRDAWCGGRLNDGGCNPSWVDWTGPRQIRHIRDWHGGGGRWKRHSFMACPTCHYKQIISNTLAGISFEAGHWESGWANKYLLCRDHDGSGDCDTGGNEHGPGWQWQWGTANFWCFNAGGTGSSVITGYNYPAGTWHQHFAPWRTVRMYVDFLNNRLYYYLRWTFPATTAWIPINQCRGWGANLNMGANDVRTPSQWNGILWFVDSSAGSLEAPAVSAYPVGSYLNTTTGVADSCPVNCYCPTLLHAVACPFGTYQAGAVASSCTSCPGGASSTPNLARACGANKNSACPVAVSSTCCSSQASWVNDGVYTGGDNYNTHHTNAECNAWTRIDMEASKQVRGGTFFGRQDGFQGRHNGFKVWVGDSATYNGAGNVNCYTHSGTEHHYFPNAIPFACAGTGRYLFVHNAALCDHLSITELEIYPELPYTGSAIDVCGCPLSMYNDGISCVACSAGNYCPGGASAPTPCTVCGAGSYASTACTASANTVCTGCSVCTAGTNYETTACTATTNRVCTSCTTCTAGTNYETTACSGTTNRVCTACSTCTAGNYRTALCTVTSNTQCSPCTACTAGTNYETTACTSTTNRVCTACSTCTGGNYRTAVCTVTANTQCAPCTTCTAGTNYETTACTATTNRVCTACTVCAPGTHETTACTATTNRVCTPCPGGSYCAGGAAAPVTCTVCSGGNYASTTCTASANTVCTGCTVCTGGSYEITACTSTVNRVCSGCTGSCAVGTHETTACTGTTNRVCTACPNNQTNLARSCGADYRSACPATQSSTYGGQTSIYAASFANDGIVAPTNINTALTDGGSNHWLRIDLSTRRAIGGGKLVVRPDCCQTDMDGFKIWVGDATTYSGSGNVNCYTHSGLLHRTSPFTVIFFCTGTGQYVYVHNPGSSVFVSVNEIEIYPEQVNLARSCGADKKSACATASSTTLAPSEQYLPSYAVDNKLIHNVWESVFLTNQATNNWMSVDFGSSKQVALARLYMPTVDTSDGVLSRMNNFKAWIGDSATYNGAGNVNCYSHSGTLHKTAPYVVLFACNGAGRYFFIHTADNVRLGVNEIEIYPTINLARSCGADGKSACNSEFSVADGRADYVASFGNDGIITSLGIKFAYSGNTINPWWRVDFGSSRSVVGGKFVNRPDGWQYLQAGFKIWVGDAITYNGAGNVNCYSQTGSEVSTAPYVVIFQCLGTGRYAYLHLPSSSNTVLGFNEIEFYPDTTNSYCAGGAAAPAPCTVCGTGNYASAPCTGLANTACSYCHNCSSSAVNLARSCWPEFQCPTSQSSTQGSPASSSNDGDLSTFGHTTTASNNWWMVDLGWPKSTASMTIVNRPDNSFNRLDGFKVWVGNSSAAYNNAANVNCYTSASSAHNTAPYKESFACVAVAQYVYVHLPANTYLHFAELEIYGPETYQTASCTPTTNRACGACSTCSAGSFALEVPAGAESSYVSSGGVFVVYAFTNVGSATVTFPSFVSADILMVGGGGAGASGGGGGGQVMTQTSQVLKGTYTVTVGAGGAAPATPYYMGGNGGKTLFSGGDLPVSWTSLGGGGGGTNGGGSDAYSEKVWAGGGAGQDMGVYPSGMTSQIECRLSSQVCAGGKALASSSCNSGGGGSGTTQLGFDAVDVTGKQSCSGVILRCGGKGGDGLQNNFRTGANVWYGGGGAGGTNTNIDSCPGGLGGQGGGGSGNGGPNQVGTAGTKNTGGGGGGSDWEASSAAGGGSGLVVIRLNMAGLPPGAESSYEIAGGLYVVYVFTNVGSSSITFPSQVTADILLVGGGGAGSTGGGGGGEVSVVTGVILSGTQTITVGNGGIPSNAPANMGGNGGSSSISGSLSRLALGGGGGSGYTTKTYGSSNVWAMGGMSIDQTVRPTDMTNKVTCRLPSTTNPCLGGVPPGTGASSGSGGGGAGSGENGQDSSTPSGTQSCGGRGGNGIQNNFRTGNNQYYSGGGGGGAHAVFSNVCADPYLSRGGLGGGGNGSISSTANPLPGVANTGGGGGGGSYYASGAGNPERSVFAAGGSGLVVIRVNLAGTSTCTIASNRACATCASCSAGFYETGACSNSVDRVCTACTTCSPGFYQTTACTATTNRVCATCATCGGGTYETTACTSTTNRACTTCTGTCGAGTYETTACTATTNRACSPCRAACAPNEYETTPCTSTTNRVCAVCPPNHYCNGVTATPCSTCATNQYRTAVCTSTANTQCQPCPPNSYCNGISTQSCTAACAPSQYETIACTATTNRVCAACPADKYCNGVSYTACTAPCALSQYETSACTSITDRVCAACPGSYFCNGVITTPCTVCVNGTYQTTACTSTVNRVCTSCPAGSYCTGGALATCPRGSYCPALASQPTLCAYGTFAQAAGLSACAGCSGN